MTPKNGGYSDWQLEREIEKLEKEQG